MAGNRQTKIERNEDGGAVMNEATQAGGTASQQGGAATAAAQQGNGGTHSGVHAWAEGQRVLAHEMIGQFGDLGGKMLQAAQQVTETACALMLVPNAAVSGVAGRQSGASDLMEDLFAAHVRTMQELFRLTDPGTLFDVQRRFASDCLDVFVQGSALVARATHRAADAALRPLEDTVEQRRQARRDERRPASSGEAAANPDGKVADVMRSQVRTASRDDTVQQATRLMREQGIGAVAVSEGDKVVGMLTDRDVALRVVAEGRDPARTKVRDVMTPDVRCVFEDDGLGRAAKNMAEQHVRRLPVVDRDERLVGVVSLGDLALNGKQHWLSGRALADFGREPSQNGHIAAE